MSRRRQAGRAAAVSADHNVRRKVSCCGLQHAVLNVEAHLLLRIGVLSGRLRPRCALQHGATLQRLLKSVTLGASGAIPPRPLV